MELILLSIVIIGFVIFYLLLNKKFSEMSNNQKPSQELLEIIKMLQSGSKEDRAVLLETLRRNTDSLNQRLDNASKVISDVQKNIGEMSEIGRGMKDLQEFMRSPKLRGNIGEQVMKDLLGQMLPKSSFHLQYGFRTGEKVDAAVTTSAGIIPIDAKFPMENFRKMLSASSDAEKLTREKSFEKDVKIHIDCISRKYIQTDEGTIDYALMYIPSEAVYYEIVNNPKLFDYASEKRVLPVSPTTFYAYLRVILMSFEGQKIESEAAKLFATIRAMQKDYKRTEDNLITLQKHLNNAYNMMGSVFDNFGRLGQRIISSKSLKNEEFKELEDTTS